MLRNKTKGLAAIAVVAIAAAGCGGSSSSSAGRSSGAGGHTYTVGVLTDLTGLAASGNRTVLDGVKAGVAVVAKDGYTIKYVVADTATSPTGALAAAQKLVQQDHVFAVIAHSALTFAAARYLTQQGIPVVGVAEDGPEWITSMNMFSVYGAIHTEKVSTTTGSLFKMQGVRTAGALGYSISPSSSEAAKATGVSAKEVGLKVGYVNANFPFGSTNVQPVALAMKNAGVDGLMTATDPNTAFALVSALRNLGHNPKVALLATGYGGDLLQAGPGALKEAQNVYFTLSYEPVEMHTPATQAFQNALKSVGVTGEPAYATYNGYLSVILLVEGLKAAGTNPTQASLVKGLSTIHNWTAAGLFGSHTMDINDRQNIVSGPDNCQWTTKLSGSSFQLVPGADPVCGKLIPGKTVSAG